MYVKSYNYIRISNTNLLSSYNFSNNLIMLPEKCFKIAPYKL